MNAKDRDKDIVCERERCRGGRMRRQDKNVAKNNSPTYEFPFFFFPPKKMHSEIKL